MIVTLRSTRRQIRLTPDMRLLDAAEYAHQRGVVTWDAVRQAERAELPPCQRCLAPANGGGWAPGERLCADCASDRIAARAAGLGRLPGVKELMG